MHGGIDPAELKSMGIDPDRVLDFSVCTNPFMPPPGIREKLSTLPVEQYPDSRASELRWKLSERLGIPPENILAGSGTTELIRLITMVFIRRGDPVLLLEPTYGEYETTGRIAGARLFRHRAREADDFTPELEEVVNIIKQYRPRVVFICNPNNPTGKYFTRKEVETVLKNIGDSLLILDEAYLAFVAEKWNSIDLARRDNIIVLRSMTKDFGLPGLRLGYAVAGEEIIENLRRVTPPWNVNIIAQKLGTAVLEEEEYLRQSLQQVGEAKNFLTEGLTRLGLKVLPSDANYFLVKVGQAVACRRSLLGHGILVRDCTSFGLPEYVRISPRTLAECEKLIAAISAILKSGELDG